MAWLNLAPVYDAGYGWLADPTTIDFSNPAQFTPCWAGDAAGEDAGQWGGLIDEMREAVEDLCGLMRTTGGWPALADPVWTRGVEAPPGSGKKRLTLSDEDAFYTSHLVDLRSEVNRIRLAVHLTPLMWSELRHKYTSVGTLVSTDPTQWDEANDASLITELRVQVDLLFLAVIAAQSEGGGV